jgi:hypothetical protein
MIYLRAGLYAEGPTDYQFLRPLLDRLMDELAASSYAGQYELGECLGIDAPAGGSYPDRADRIAAAVHAHRDECTLVVIHSDGAGDPVRARSEQVTPGIDAARARCADRPVATAACIPVREIEAWMLADPDVFLLVGSSTPPACPAEPEREVDPKATLDRLLADSGARRRRQRPRDRAYALFGENVRLACLRRLPAFVSFETELASAIAEVAGHQGLRP